VARTSSLSLAQRARAELELRRRRALNPPKPVWAPHPDNKPQQMAFASEAFEILFGGSAGGGKTDLLLGLARTCHRRSLLIRRTFPDLERSMISRSMEFFGPPNYYNGSKHVWTVGKVRCEFGHMDHIGSPQIPGDESHYASAPYDFIGFDQLEQFPQYAYEFMLSRARSAVPGQRVQIVSSANPVGENIDWLIRRWAPWLDESHPNPAVSGELRYYKRQADGLEVETTKDDPDALSRTFIAAGLKDNPYLGDDYRRTLNLLPEPLRSALLNGDWKASITDDAYQVIPRSWVKLAQQRWQPQSPGPITALGVDVARGGMDQTVLSARHGEWFDRLRKYPGMNTPDGQSVVTLILQVVSGKHVPVNIDVIGVGSSAYDIAKGVVDAVGVNFAEGSTATDVSGKLGFINLRAEVYWKLREALDPNSSHKLALPDDPELMADLCAPRWLMQRNGIKIESKDDIKSRIRRSTDCGDATALSWYRGASISASDWIAALKKKNAEAEAGY
jgi:hypothetical protein